MNRRLFPRFYSLVIASIVFTSFGSGFALTKTTSPLPRAIHTPRRSRKASHLAQESFTSSLTGVKLARATAVENLLNATPHPQYKKDVSNGELVPDIHAQAAIVYDPVTNQIIWGENAKTEHSIASITKVMTAKVFFEDDPDLTKIVTIQRSDVFNASTTNLRVNDRVSVNELLHLLLIPSDNGAARALARISSWGMDGFVKRMNERAVTLGLEQTHYADPSGLFATNVSSAYDMARLITLVSGDERIASIMRTPEYTAHTTNRAITVHSTNHLLGRSDIDVRAGKTGFISKAGFCLATLLMLPQTGQQVAVVVLGAPSNAGRFLETRDLFSWMSAKTPAAVKAMPETAPQLPPQ